MVRGQSNDTDDTQLKHFQRRDGWWLAGGAAAFVVCGGLALLFVPAMLIRNWTTAPEQGALLWPAAQVVLFSMGGVIAVVGVGLSWSRHNQEVQAADRDRVRLRHDQERALRDRFVTLLDLITNSAATTRQAGLYGLGALADDWDRLGRRDEVQICIEVISAYLRAPLTENMSRTSADEVAVKQAGYGVIRGHLTTGSDGWGDRHINLSGAHIDFAVDLSGARLSAGGYLQLDNALICEGGHLRGDYATITDGGQLSVSNATIAEGGKVQFDVSEVSIGGQLRFDNSLIRDHGVLQLDSLTIADRSSVTFLGVVVIDGGYVQLWNADVSRASYLNLYRLEVNNARACVDEAKIRDESAIVVGGAAVNQGGELSLREAYVEAGGEMSFANATVNERGELRLDGCVIDEGGKLSLERVKVNDAGYLSADRALVKAGGELTFDSARIGLRSKVSLAGTTVDEGGYVRFDGAAIGGGGRTWLSGATIQDDGPVLLPDQRRMLPQYMP